MRRAPEIVVGPGGVEALVCPAASAPWARLAGAWARSLGAPSRSFLGADVAWRRRAGRWTGFSWRTGGGARREERLFGPGAPPARRARFRLRAEEPRLEPLGLRPFTLEFAQLEELAWVELAAPAPGHDEGEALWAWARPVAWKDFLCLSPARGREGDWAGAPSRLTAVSLSGGALRLHGAASRRQAAGLLGLALDTSGGRC